MRSATAARPGYVRGQNGVVVDLLGTFKDPVRLAYHRPGLPAQPLYKVRIRQKDLWPDYTGAAKDTLEVDIYEPWLGPAAKPGKRATRGT